MGSLFLSREWWSTRPGSEEEFGSGGLVIANFDNEPNGSLKIATGSFDGVLRVYAPSGKDYKLEDLMLESALDAPILQLAAGHFLAEFDRVALAVLHPRKITVFTVVASGGKEASFFSLNKSFEHALEHPACNMVQGAFGGIFKGENLCVQSMDGCDA